MDSSVLIDVQEPRSEWHSWSSATLTAWRYKGALFYNQVIAAEVLAGSLAPERVILGAFDRRDLPWEVVGPAADAQSAYRSRGGVKHTRLPDFLIGAHALVEELALITRDPRRIRTAFPRVRLITPTTDPL